MQYNHQMAQLQTRYDRINMEYDELSNDLQERDEETNQLKKTITSMKRKWHRIFPQTPYQHNSNNIDMRRIPGDTIKNRVLSTIKNLLFFQNDYVYQKWDIYSLFDEILRAADIETHRIRDCVDLAIAAKQYFKRMDLRSREDGALRDRQTVAGALMFVQSGCHIPRNKKIFNCGKMNILAYNESARDQRGKFIKEAAKRRCAFNGDESIKTLHSIHKHALMPPS